MNANSLQPNLAWYKDASGRQGVLPRCPFASVGRCPRFYQSLALLGDAGVATAIAPEEDRRLLAAWGKSDLWPRTNEQASAVMGASENPKHFVNFCPEVSFDRFGLFAVNLHRYADEIDEGVAHERLGRDNFAGADWQWTWASVTPMHYTDCPLYSPLMKDGPNHVSLAFNVMSNERNDLDPFRVALIVIEDSDTLVRVGNAAGLRFDASLNEKDAVSHKTRVRALLPRVLAAYEALDGETRLTAARAAAGELQRSGGGIGAAASEALARAGWELRGLDIVVRSPETREVFFPKGSPWDAFVVLRDLFAEARESITIVDAYCNATVFQMLADRPLDKLHVRVLCSQYATAVAAEAKVFAAQHPGVSIEIRQTKDFHDRFLVIDSVSCIHVGASIKDAGKTAFMVSRVEDQANRDALIQQTAVSWAAGKPVA